MPKIMLIDTAQVEETRVAVMDGNRLDNFDIESASKKQLKGNIYLAKVTRVEPSLQAAFVNYGGNRHGFLPFSEIHPDYYRIPVEDRERLMAEQEELRRQIQEEAEARELAEAEAAARAEAMGDDAEGEVVAEAEALDTVDAAEDAENSVEANADDEQDDEQEGSDVDAEGEAEGDAEDGEELEAAEGEDANGEDGEEATNEEGEDGAGRRERGRGGRGRDSRGRGRGGRGRDGRGRGLERRSSSSDEVVDREDEEEVGMAALWKRMRRAYKIQEVIKRGQIMLIQVVKEERGNKGAAVTSYITMPGRYCVLMPNSPQSGGVSRKVASHAERRKMRDMLKDLQVPDGMSVILRTAGVDRSKVEIKRDLDYLMRLWDSVRENTMQSSAPALIYEEGNLVKRAIRDLYTSEIDEILVEGEEGVKVAKDVMKMMMPSHVRRVRAYKDVVPLFTKYNAEPQIDAIHSNTVQLKSGGYLVINPTEALVSIDINSGRATRERHIEETAVKTNLEAADEIARQLRLRDLGGLVVIDFIDMENRKNNAAVERRMRDALSGDRARVQVGRISSFGLLELSRQRLRPSLTETHFHTCPHCQGLGVVRTTEAMALAVMRAIDNAGMEGRAGEVTISVTENVALFLFNVKRAQLAMLEARYNLAVIVRIVPIIESAQGFEFEITKSRRAVDIANASVDPDLSEDDEDMVDDVDGDAEANAEVKPAREARTERSDDDRDGRRRRGRRGGRGRNRGDKDTNANGDVDGNVIREDGEEIDDNIGNRKDDSEVDDNVGNRVKSEDGGDRDGRRRRGRRGGRGRNRGDKDTAQDGDVADNAGNVKSDVDVQDAAPVAETEASAPASTPRAPRAPRTPRAPRAKKEDGAPVKAEKAAKVEKQTPAQAASAPVPSSVYDVVSEVSDDGAKKKGWWKKLTG